MLAYDSNAVTPHACGAFSGYMREARPARLVSPG